MALTDQAAALPLDLQLPDLGEHILVVDKARLWCSEKVPEHTDGEEPPSRGLGGECPLAAAREHT